MKSKYTKGSLQSAVEKSKSFRGVVRYFGLKPHGGMADYLKKKIQGFGISTEHFRQDAWNKGIVSGERKTYREILIKDIDRKSTVHGFMLLRALKEIGRPPGCELCGLEEWNNKPLNLEVDHIDGDKRNNEQTNLRVLCPNCHSQTPNYRHRGRLTRKTKLCSICKSVALCVVNKTGMCLNCFNKNRER